MEATAQQKHEQMLDIENKIYSVIRDIKDYRMTNYDNELNLIIDAIELVVKSFSPYTESLRIAAYGL